MRKRRVPKVMAERSQTDTMAVVSLRLSIDEWLVSKTGVKRAASEVHDTQGVIVPGVGCSRKGQVGKAELPYSAKTLDERLIDDGRLR